MPRHRIVAPRGKGGRKVILDVRHDRTFMKLSKLVEKDEWQEVLGYFPDNAKAVKLLMLLSNPLFNKASFGKLAVMSGLSTAELTLFFSNAKKQEGIVRMSQKLPDIMEQTAEDALSSLVPCERCGGEGQRKDKPCTSCEGKGFIKVKGDLDNRKLVLEMAGLIGKRGSGQAVQINIGGYRSLEERIGLTERLLAEPFVDAVDVKEVDDAEASDAEPATPAVDGSQSRL